MLTIQSERRGPSLRAEVTPNDEVLLASGSFQLDFNITSFFVVFDERTDLACTTQDLKVDVNA